MLHTVQFDDQMMFPAQEIDNVGAKRDLTDKFVAMQAAVFEVRPEEPLFLSFVFAELAGEGGFVGLAVGDGLS